MNYEYYEIQSEDFLFFFFKTSIDYTEKGLKTWRDLLGVRVVVVMVRVIM